ncbi:MAG: ABC transporter permease [Alphaproteobacteria bacterium]|nr:ABC transporter permease [Alphaproteobacteria bacterium]
MALTPRYLNWSSGLRHAGVALWLGGAAIAGLPGLLFAHRLTRRRVVEALFDVAARPLSLLTVLAASLGAAVAFSVGLALGVIDVDALLLGALRHILTRDIAPLLVGIFVAGRSGVALAVRLRRMAMAGEMDALRLMGESPARYVLSPALLGFFAAAAGLYLWGLFIAHFSAALVLDARHVVAIARYRDLVAAAAATDIYYGLVRALVFGLLAFLVAAYEGSRAGGSSEVVEDSAGKTFVYALILIFAAEAVFAGLNA